MTPSPMIVQLTLERTIANLPQLIEIGRDLAWQTWTEQNFLDHRPRKFDLSLVALRDERAIGYAIVSERMPEVAHLHHFMLVREERRLGIGSTLLKRSLSLAVSEKFRSYTLKVATNNTSAQGFYRFHRFEQMAVEGDYVWMSRQLP